MTHEAIEQREGRYLADRFQWAAPGDQQHDVWMVRFCDQERRDAIFTGPEAEAEAWAAWEQYAPGYNMYVFRLARLAAEQARASDRNDRLARRIAEVVEEDGGCWTPCSGCQEGVDGYVSARDYPYNSTFKCQPGGGCGECGGIGVIWNDGAFLASYGDALFLHPSTEPADTTTSLEAERARPFDDWHEGHGDVLWWKLPISEAPYCGSPLDLGRTMKVTVQVGVEEHDLPSVTTGGWPFDEDDEDVLWWTPLPKPTFAIAERNTDPSRSDE
ncbi:MAG TPA: hypothetical protein DEP91_03115 [Sphingomonas bacterium]|jgi:hypothetical protein|uniref:Uncharacterized protein n=1 Tax=Sphingomonas bacterium TaxID=1895847 RepID=A0A3D0W8U1_9SPHN|nr:hypothetical protein [Sphingomonas bacterium]